jgi:hypothetical protein
MSQNGANWLGQRGWGYEAILRFFYGEDIEIGRFDEVHEAGRGSVLVGLLVLATLGLAITGTAGKG